MTQNLRASGQSFSGRISAPSGFAMHSASLHQKQAAVMAVSQHLRPAEKLSRKQLQSTITQPIKPIATTNAAQHPASLLHSDPTAHECPKQWHVLLKGFVMVDRLGGMWV